MIEFDYALYSTGNIAEALDAAGIDDHVPSHEVMADGDDGTEFVPADLAWAAGADAG